MSADLQSAEGIAGYIQSLDCIHCGLCKEACPTYRQTGRETASPRGRLHLMRGLMEQRIEPTAPVLADLDLCLVCRACESVCPSGVRYGEVIAETRARTRKRGAVRRRLMNLMTDRQRLARFAGKLRLWQRSGLRFMRHALPGRLKRMESYLPPIPAAEERRPLPPRVAARGEPRGRVALLEGCVGSILYQDVNRDTLRLLQAAGYEVVVPEGQVCCGALHVHDGDLETARTLLRTNAAVFAAASVTHVVTNAAGCGAGLKEAEHLLQNGDGCELTAKTVDISRFLVDHGEALRFEPCDTTVTYDAPCHLHHAQGETGAPLELLGRVPDLRLVALAGADRCCGAAGIYNLDHPEMSRQVLAEKLDALEQTGARTLLTGNPGCLLQWRGGIAERGLDVEVLHPVTFLAAQLA